MLPLQKRPGWRNPRVAQDWMVSLGRYAFPHIGRLSVSEVTSADVIGILAPIWHEKPPTVRKLRQRIRAVLEWDVAMEFRIDNPCDRVGSVLGTQDAVVRHMRALPHREVEAAYRRTDLFERRRVLMEDLARYPAGESRQPASVRLR